MVGDGPRHFLVISLRKKSISCDYRGSRRIRHYGLFAGTVRARNIERVRQWLAAPEGPPSVRAPRPDVRLKMLRLRAPLPVLRRPDDHRRDVRRPAPLRDRHS